MNKLKSSDYLKHVQRLQSIEYDITKRKNADYAWKDLAFKNFDMVEQLGICSAETGILVRLTDKLSRIINLLNTNSERQVLDESISDTLTDMANYARILNIYLLTKPTLWTAENSIDMQLDS